METLGIYQNIPVSDTKLMVSLCIDFISPHLVVDKLIPVNSRAITSPPKISNLLEVKCMPAVIIEPKLILVLHMNDLNWYKTFE